MSRHNVTVQFPSRNDYDKLRVVALIDGQPIGRVLSRLVNADITKRGIRLEKKEGKK